MSADLVGCRGARLENRPMSFFFSPFWKGTAAGRCSGEGVDDFFDVVWLSSEFCAVCTALTAAVALRTLPFVTLGGDSCCV